LPQEHVRMKRERKTLEAMIRMYCGDLHGGARPDSVLSAMSLWNMHGLASTNAHFRKERRPVPNARCTVSSRP